MATKIDGYEFTQDDASYIGGGQYGEVYRGRDTIRDRDIAVKKLKLHDDEDYLKMLRREREILQELSHLNIVELYHSKLTDHFLYLFTEICDDHLGSYVKKASSLSQDRCLGFMLSIGSALQYMHGLDIAHRDIKPENILIKLEEGEPVIKLCDLGQARPMSGKATIATLCGTPNYLAPEVYPDVMDYVRYSTAVDIFSAGIVFLALSQAKPGEPLKPLKVGAEPLGKVMADKMKIKERMDPPILLIQSDDMIINRVKTLVIQMTFQDCRERCTIHQVVGTLHNIRGTISNHISGSSDDLLQLSQDPDDDITAAAAAAAAAEAKSGAIGGTPSSTKASAPMDLKDWKDYELRHAMNTETDVDKLMSYQKEFQSREEAYKTWKAKQTTGDDRAPHAPMEEKDSTHSTVNNLQRFFRIPHVRPSDRKKGRYLGHFDGDCIARQMELFDDEKPVLLVSGVDDDKMCKVSLEETGLTRKSGAKITEAEFEKEWNNHGGRAYLREVANQVSSTYVENSLSKLLSDY